VEVRAGIASYTAHCIRVTTIIFSAFVVCDSIPETTVVEEGKEEMFEITRPGQPSKGVGEVGRDSGNHEASAGALNRAKPVQPLQLPETHTAPTLPQGLATRTPPISNATCS